MVFIEVEFKLKSIKRLFREKLVGDEDGKGIKIYIYIFFKCICVNINMFKINLLWIKV